MNKPAATDEILAAIRAMPLEERHRITAELLHDLDADFEEPQEVLEELRRRAEDALAHPERGSTIEETMAEGREAIASARARKG